MKGFTSKAKSAELYQFVNVKSRKVSGVPFKSDFFPEIADELNIAVQRTARSAARIGQRIADCAVEGQRAGIHSYYAIFTGNLYGSIEARALSYGAESSSFKVGTSLQEDYPHYLIRGRKAVHGNPRLAFPFYPGGEVHFFRAVKEAAPRDYVAYSDSITQARIPQIVEEELASVFE